MLMPCDTPVFGTRPLPAQIPATTNVPTPSGVVASTVPRPGTAPRMGFDDFREMIPGEPDRAARSAPQQVSQPMPLPEFLPPQTQRPPGIPGIPPPQTLPQTPPSQPMPRPPGGPVPPPVLPQAPQFQVPPNPLLPPGFQDFIDYENLQYLNGFLRTQIGKYMRVEQLVGSNSLEDRYGYLVGVGINYILLQEIGTGNIMAIDYYGIKSLYVYNNQNLFPPNR